MNMDQLNNGGNNIEQYIHIKDKNKVIHKWLIEEDIENSYKISCNGFITEISKQHTYLKDDLICTSDIRNPWCTLENKKYSKAEYCEIWLER